MIILSRPEIEALIDLDHALAAVEAAYIAASDGRAVMPPVGYLAFPDKDGDCHIKYGHIAGDPAFVVKVAAGFYGNPAIGLPTSNGVMLVLSAETGTLEAILLDEGFLTDLRTGLGGAIATRALCRPDARRVGIAGTGIQARWQVRCLQQAMPGTQFSFTIWRRSEDKARETANALKAEGIDVLVSSGLERLCRDAEIIITTTPSREPLDPQRLDTARHPHHRNRRRRARQAGAGGRSGDARQPPHLRQRGAISRPRRIFHRVPRWRHFRRNLRRTWSCSAWQGRGAGPSRRHNHRRSHRHRGSGYRHRKLGP